MWAEWNLLEVTLFFFATLAVGPLGTLIHELGHAITARRFGAPVRALVAAPEGPALSLVVAGVRVRVGLGLGRDLNSTAPAGWVLIATERLTTEQAITALRAGPIAQAVYGAAGLVVVLAAQMPWFPTLVLVVGLGETTINAFGNLRADGSPESDGARIAALRDYAILEKWDLVPSRPRPCRCARCSSSRRGSAGASSGDE